MILKQAFVFEQFLPYVSQSIANYCLNHEGLQTETLPLLDVPA